MNCSCCGYDTRVEFVDVEWQEEQVALCVLCRTTGIALAAHELPRAQAQVPMALARIANALVDAHGASYRDAVESSLTGGELAAGTYDTFEG